ncbi:MAG: beta-ketoacyl synthase [Armatimonadota bacterium]
MSKRRVVVTGLGLVTPLGIGTGEFWPALIEGRSAVTRVNFVEPAGEPRHAVARVPQLDLRSLVSDRKLLRIMCESDRYALAAASLAAREAGECAQAPARRGAFVGTRKELMAYDMLRDATAASVDEEGRLNSLRLGEFGYSQIPPLSLVTGMPNGCLFALSVLHSIQGSGANLIGSGEIGLAAIGAAYRAIQQEQVEWALAGGQDAGANQWDYADLLALGLLSGWTGDPAETVKPFDRRRDGCVLGDGAGVVVLEELGSALARGATILAEVRGYAESCDARGLLQLDPVGAALARAIQTALSQAGLSPDEVGYVNASGVATAAADRAEARALELVFGKERRRPLVSGLKGALGHLLAASGAVEFGATVLALHHQLAPPTRNLTEPDPEFDLDFVRGRARAADIGAAITISRGIGGQNAVAVLSRWDSH